MIAIKAPSGTTLEVPDPDEGMEYPQRRYPIHPTLALAPSPSPTPTPTLTLTPTPNKVLRAVEDFYAPSLQVARGWGDPRLTLGLP